MSAPDTTFASECWAPFVVASLKPRSPSTPDSTLAQMGDVRLVIDTSVAVDPGNMMAMGSALAMCSVGDALTVALMEIRRYSWEAFMRTHPGGAVGHRIQRS